MEFFKPGNLKLEFTKHFKFFTGISIVLTIVALVALIKPGLNYGIDFRGGIEAHLSFSEPVQISDLRQELEPKLENLSIVSFSDTSGKQEFLITARTDSREDVTAALNGTLTAKYGAMGESTWAIERMDVVGAKVGADLRKSALLSLIYTCLLVALYMYWRFDMRFTPGVLMCVLHDLLIVAGFIALLRIEFSTTIVAALLTLAGYSINDTVVVYDRIREVEGKFLGKTREQLLNFAINSTISRTVMTSVTTLGACLIIYFFGGSTLQDFALVLFVGIIVGTYSTFFVSAPLYLWADKKFGAAAQAAIKAGRA